MEREYILQPIAIFVITLIVMIPFYISDAYATSLTVNNIGGDDDIYKYRRKNDNITVDVNVQIDEDSYINYTQLELNGVNFNHNCTEVGVSTHTFNCIYSAYGGDIVPGAVPYTINVYDDSGSIAWVQTENVYVDNLAPVIKSFNIIPSVSNGVVNLTYAIEDYAYSSGDTTKCSGINSIQFYKNDTVIATQTVTASCSVSGGYIYTSLLDSGTEIIYAVAADRFGFNSTAVSDSFEIDKSGPSIQPTLQIVYQGTTTNVTYLKDEDVTVEISAKIKATDLNTASIKADLSSLNPSYNAALAPDTFSPRDVNNITTAYWSNKVLDVSHIFASATAVTPSISVNVSDNAGNIDIKTATGNAISQDIIGPVVAAIKTSAPMFNNSYYIGTKPMEIILEITETGVGLNNKEFYLNLAAIGGSSSLQATNCNETWKCYFDSISVASGSGIKTISVLTSSKDDLGNLVNATASVMAANITTDTTSPVINSINITTVGADIDPYSNYTVAGNSLKITANITEATTVTAVADLSSVIMNETSVSGSCSLVSGYYICTWQSSPINIEGPYTASLKFNFSDLVGNSASTTKSLFVFGRANETAPDYWVSATECMPDLFDRQITNIIAYRSYCHLALTPKSAEQNPATVSISFSSCQDVADVNVSSTAYLEKTYVMNNLQGSKDPYIALEFMTFEANIDSLDLICPVQIRTEIDDKVTTNLETENATVKIEFYNSPLGEIGDDVETKIEDILEDAWVKLDWIGTLMDILKIMESICNFLHMFQTIVNILADLEFILGKTAVTLPWAMAIDKLNAGNYEGANVLITTLYKTCAYVSCDRTLWGDWYSQKQESSFGTMWDDEDVADRGSDWGTESEMGEGWVRLWPESPKESIILSMATGCLPGIIYGIQKWRNVQCNYGLCLKTAALYNIPLSTCEEQKSFLECKFIYGEIFQIFPFAAAIQDLLGYFTGIISDPLSLVFGGIHLACYGMGGYSPAEPNWRSFCVIADTIPKIAKLIDDVDRLSNIREDWAIEDDLCEDLEGALG